MRLAYFKTEDLPSQVFSSAFQGKFMHKFASTLTSFLEKEKTLFMEIFADPKLQSLHKEFYEKLITRLLADHKEKVIQEFIYGLSLDTQGEAFSGLILPMIEITRTSVPSQVSFDGNLYLMIKEMYQGMGERYRKQLDSIISEAFESLISGD